MIGLMTKISDTSPEDLLQIRFKKALRGDQDSFWALIEPHSGLIYSVAFGILKDPEQAQDILHEVYIEAFKSISNLRKANRLPAWLHSLTRNLCYNIIRKSIRAEQGKVQVLRARPKVVPIDEVLIKEEELKQLQIALGELPESFRIILGMKYMNQKNFSHCYSCKEIAGILDISVEAVKSRLFEARKLLAIRMSENQKQPQSLIKGGIKR